MCAAWFEAYLDDQWYVFDPRNNKHLAGRILMARGRDAADVLAVGDGALGFWKALPKVYGQTRSQRCWVHKTKNVLIKEDARLRRSCEMLSGQHQGVNWDFRRSC